MAHCLRDALGVLVFRRPSSAIEKNPERFLIFGLFFTWLAGAGRYWDNPHAGLWQVIGLGSLVYVFVLAALIWLLVLPLRPKRWSYRQVLIFISLTSPPAVLYAIPVERFLPLSAAQDANAWFLAVVATWRVTLLLWFLRTFAGLALGTAILASLLPLAIIVAVLAMLNLEHVIFNIMAGIQPHQRSANDTAYVAVAIIGVWSILLSPVLLILYLVAIYRAHHLD